MSIIAEPVKKGRKVKGMGERNKVLSIRISDETLHILNKICDTRKSEGLAWSSQADIVELALKYYANAD